MRIPIPILSLAAATIALPSNSISAPAPRHPGPSLSEFLNSLTQLPAEDKKLKPRQTNATLPSAEVTLCTGPLFTGSCVKPSWPVNGCIDLKGYSGNVLSFEPAAGFDCLLMEGQCDATAPYVDIDGSDPSDASKADDLSSFSWIKNATSYMCFTDVSAARRFVRVARLGVGMLVEE